MNNPFQSPEPTSADSKGVFKLLFALGMTFAIIGYCGSFAFCFFPSLTFYFIDQPAHVSAQVAFLYFLTPILICSSVAIAGTILAVFSIRKQSI